MKVQVLLVVFLASAALAAGAAVDQQQATSGPSSGGGLWERFHNFFRTVWLPFVEERLIKIRPPPVADKVSRSVEDGAELQENEDRELKFAKVNMPSTRYTENAIYSLRAGLAWGPYQAKAAVVPLTGLVDTGPATPPTGTLRILQPTIFSDISVAGVITGLVAHEVINVHVRARGDVTANCANQGDVFNPNLVTTGAGGNIGTFTANAAGVATIDVPKINPVNFDMYENSIYGRSVRVSRTNNGGLPRLCGIVGYP